MAVPSSCLVWHFIFAARVSAVVARFRGLYRGYANSEEGWVRSRSQPRVCPINLRREWLSGAGGSAGMTKTSG